MILVVNAGSSNVKYAVYDNMLALVHKDQVDTMQGLFDWLTANKQKYRISSVGHRIVHGGTMFFNPIVLTAQIIEQLEELVPLAPLHLPHNIAAVKFLQQAYPDLKQVGCFDTAFHRTQNKLAKQFAIPNELTDLGIIRYGFHGLSYEYIASVIENKLDIDLSKKIIIAHLGNGASMCAMENGRSVATTMGFSVLDGLMMGTRGGSIDPGVLLYLLQEKNYTLEQLSDLLYKKSGLLGVSNLSNDVQTLLTSDDANSALAIDLFCYKAATQFGALAAGMRGCAALIFTGGIGENAVLIREKICNYLYWLGLNLDNKANARNETILSTPTSKILVARLPTDEELVIARHTKLKSI